MMTAFAALASFCLGIAGACAGVIIAARKNGLPRASGRLSALCTALSFAIVFAALALILFPQEQIFFAKFAALYYCVFAAAGIAAGIWFRAAFPLIIVLYACYGFWMRAPLAKLFPPLERSHHIIRIDSDSVVFIDGARHEFAAPESSAETTQRGWTLVFEQYSLPQRWLVPFRAKVIRLAGAASQNNPDSVLLTAAGIESPTLFSFSKELLKSRAEQTLSLPAPEIYPAEYKIGYAMKNQNFTITLTKIF
jgi:hypothetical protein